MKNAPITLPRRQIFLERHYPHAPERVWRALTDPDALAEWLMPTRDFALRPGQEFTFHTTPAPGFDGVVHCRITELEPPHRLAYTWQGGGMKNPTTVVWTLAPAGGGTLLTLEHHGFEGLGGRLIQFVLGRGWRRTVLRKLENYLSL